MKIGKIFNMLTPLGQFRQVNKGISDTQRVALKSGTVGYEGSVFSGKPDWKGLFSTPAPKLSKEEQDFLDNEVEEICKMIDDWKIRDSDHTVPDNVMNTLKKKKIFGMIIPKEYGGLGFSAAAHSAVITKIATRSGTVSATAMVPNSLGPAELILRYGTQEQKDHYLPRLANGDEVPCFSLTSPQAGSDATNLADEGVVFKDKDGKIKIRMNWEKRYITLAPVATLFGVAMQLKDPDHLLGDQDNVGITLALAPADTPGITRGTRHRPMGMHFMNGPHWGKDVVVPIENIIGGKDYAGKGWGMLVDCLSVGRSISLPASSSGTAKLAARTTGAYSFIRQQFALPLSKMEGVQESLGRIGGLTYLIEAAKTLPLQDLDLAHDAGEDARPAVSSAILKYHTTEAARQIAIDAMDVHAGKGVVEGPNNPVGAIYQGIPIAVTVEGANILTRNVMIFGQGAFLAHPYTLKEIGLAEDYEAGKVSWKKGQLKASKLLAGHLTGIFTNAARGFVHGLTAGHLSRRPRAFGPDAAYYRHINRMSATFAYAADVTALTLQASLIKYQRTSALLGDVFSNLYLASQVLRRWDLEGRKKEDIPLMKWASEYCLNNAYNAFSEMVHNHPSKIAKAMLMPFLISWKVSKPSHKLDGQIAKILSAPGEARDRLTDGMYIPKGGKDYIARLEKTLKLAHQSHPIEQTLYKAAKKGKLSQIENYEAMIHEAYDKKLIKMDELKLLARAHRARVDIVEVDHFPQNWNGEAMLGKPKKKAGKPAPKAS